MILVRSGGSVGAAPLCGEECDDHGFVCGVHDQRNGSLFSGSASVVIISLVIENYESLEAMMVDWKSQIVFVSIQIDVKKAYFGCATQKCHVVLLMHLKSLVALSKQNYEYDRPCLTPC